MNPAFRSGWNMRVDSYFSDMGADVQYVYVHAEVAVHVH